MKEKGFSLIILLIIVIVGVVIGVVVFILSNSQSKAGSKVGSETGKNGILQTVKEKIAQPKPAPAIETGKVTTQTSPTSPETPAIKSNFSHEGAFFAREGEDGWTFLWDEPGRLALNVKVKFTSKSVCILGGEKKDCGLTNMGPQSYDRVSLEGERIGDEVTVIKIEEVKMPL